MRKKTIRCFFKVCYLDCFLMVFPMIVFLWFFRVVMVFDVRHGRVQTGPQKAVQSRPNGSFHSPDRFLMVFVLFFCGFFTCQGRVNKYATQSVPNVLSQTMFGTQLKSVKCGGHNQAHLLNNCAPK